jgi:hypothetical protein
VLVLRLPLPRVAVLVLRLPVPGAGAVGVRAGAWTAGGRVGRSVDVQVERPPYRARQVNSMMSMEEVTVPLAFTV